MYGYIKITNKTFERKLKKGLIPNSWTRFLSTQNAQVGIIYAKSNWMHAS